MNEKALTVRKLLKEYGKLKAVDYISFDVHKGEVFGILGPNGAGKTTTLEIIEGLRKKTSGTITVLGIEEKGKKSQNKIQEKIGVQLQSSSYFEYLKLIELLDLFGSFYPKRLDPLKLLKDIQLEEKKNELVKNLSGGQAHRFSIVAALVNDPEIVFLDEPTTGLDPNIRRELWDLIRKINKEGKTIILTTHYMEEAQVLCDRVAIMNEGKIMAVDSPQNLIDQQKLPMTVKFMSDTDEEKIRTLEKISFVQTVQKEKEKFVLKVDDVSFVNDLLNEFEKNKLSIKNLEILPPTLEDVFLHLTGRKLGNNHA